MSGPPLLETRPTLERMYIPCSVQHCWLAARIRKAFLTVLRPQSACQAILRPLLAFVLECSKQAEFKAKLEIVIQSTSHMDSDEFVQHLFEPRHTTEDVSDDD